QALTELEALPELEGVEVHELEDAARAAEEYVEDLEWLLQVDSGLRERYGKFCAQSGLNASTDPLDPTAASRFMEALNGFDFAVVRFPGGGEGDDGDEDGGDAVAGEGEVKRAWTALVRFAKRRGYRLMDPQHNDPGEFVDLDNPGELPPAF
ncbi:MAG TPA: hypothetical protein VK447_17840, partial [Myxococcaceae bacterium]|nr:hypothetical protein [Myxococcaceae bacterium]